MKSIKKGEIHYSKRAFGQDAELAIRGDVVRALIELITNADDAYKGQPGGVKIDVRNSGDPAFPVVVEVRDSATGLTAAELEYHFATLGREKDEPGSRGLFGRGAKDCASLGRLRVQTVKNGRYSSFTLERSGEWELIAADKAADGKEAMEAGFAADTAGLSAAVDVRKGVRVPSADHLADELANHAQLRDLLNRIEIRFTDRRRSKPWSKNLPAPIVEGDVVIDEDLAVSGYQPIHLTLRRLPAEDPKPVSAWSKNGLLISAGMTIFQNTWFHLDRGRPESGRFAGVVRAPQISDIVRAFDKSQSDGSPSSLGGPTRLVARDRDGLVPEHPYTKALVAALAEKLIPIFEEASKQLHADQREGVQLRKDLATAASALKDELRKALDELDDDPSGGSEDDGEEHAALTIIPPRRRCRTGETATLTLRALEEIPLPLLASVASQTVEGVVTGVSCPDVAWTPHPRMPAFIARLLIDVGPTEGVAVVSVQAGEIGATAEIIVDDTQEPIQIPDKLGFAVDRASVSPGRARRLRVCAPLVDDGRVLAVLIEGDVVKPDATEIKLRPERDGRWVEGILRVVASDALGTCKVTVADSEGSATCSVQVRRVPASEDLPLKFELSGMEVGVRSTRKPLGAGLLVEVYAKHRSLSAVFGPYDDKSRRFRDEDTPAARAVLAEVIADELADHLTEEAYTKRPDLLNDASRVLRDRARSALRFLPVLHRALRPD